MTMASRAGRRVVLLAGAAALTAVTAHPSLAREAAPPPVEGEPSPSVRAVPPGPPIDDAIRIAIMMLPGEQLVPLLSEVVIAGAREAAKINQEVAMLEAERPGFAASFGEEHAAIATRRAWATLPDLRAEFAGYLRETLTSDQLAFTHCVWDAFGEDGRSRVFDASRKAMLLRVDRLVRDGADGREAEAARQSAVGAAIATVDDAMLKRVDARCAAKGSMPHRPDVDMQLEAMTRRWSEKAVVVSEQEAQALAKRAWDRMELAKP